MISPVTAIKISPTINPIEAGLNFAVKMDKDFIGREAILNDYEQGPKRKVVALELIEKGIARSDYLVEAEGQIVGKITTGYMIPNTNKVYAFAMLASKYTSIGTEVLIHIRKNRVKARVRNKRFLIKKYFK